MIETSIHSRVFRSGWMTLPEAYEFAKFISEVQYYDRPLIKFDPRTREWYVTTHVREDTPYL